MKAKKSKPPLTFTLKLKEKHPKWDRSLLSRHRFVHFCRSGSRFEVTFSAHGEFSVCGGPPRSGDLSESVELLRHLEFSMCGVTGCALRLNQRAWYAAFGEKEEEATK